MIKYSNAETWAEQIGGVGERGREERRVKQREGREEEIERDEDRKKEEERSQKEGGK